ncbi:MAG: cbb3-type cytochrome c oxidase subunit I [Myxococcaceae bacterium]|nr:cbb3-type cytochrome c oxidase subunit I [Myxococcaceae bacterium]
MSAEERLRAVWKTPSGWRYWSSVNNSDVGVWYVAATFVFFVFGGVLALLMRVQLAKPGNTVLEAEQYAQVFTVHGSVMMFLFALPIFEAIAVIILPQLLGARDLPFPRLSAFGFWCFVIGGVFLCGSLFFGVAPRGGWFMYPPLTSSYQPDIGADFWLLGFSFIEVSAIAAAIELVVGVLKCRPPGMRLNLMPPYAWYVLVAAAMILFAFPPLIAGSLLLELERAFGWGFFDPRKGGDPLLWQHLFWLFGHPEVYVIFLPSVALLATMLPTVSKRPLVGYGGVVLAAVGIGFLSFGLWVHHMYTTGLPGVSLGLFSAASTAVGLPTAVQFACFVATLLAGKPQRSVPLYFTAAGIVSFVLGGLTGVMVAMAPFDFQAHDTYFIVGHLHFVLIAGAVFPIFGGLYYFFPIATGRQLSQKLGTVACALVFVGFNLTFLPMHLTGLRGMPRRVFTYAAGHGLETPNLVSTVGAFVLALGVLVILFDVLRPKKKQGWSPRNPWGAGTLEWLQAMPGEDWGVRAIPVVTSRYPLWDDPGLVARVDAGEGYLPDAEEGLRETLIVSSVDAKPLQVQRLPGSSFLPMLSAFAVGGFFVFGTYHWWGLALSSLALGAVLICKWLWSGTGAIPEKPAKLAAPGVELPLYASGSGSIGWMGLFIMLLADLTAFASIVFGYFFFWTVHDDFPPRDAVGPGVLWPVTGLALVLAAWGLTLLARRLNRAEVRAGAVVSLGLSAALAAAGAAALLYGPWVTGLKPSQHVYPAVVWVLVAWAALHLAVGVVMLGYCAVRRLTGRMTATYDGELQNTTLYWHFTALTALITVAVIAGFPLAT